MTLLTIIQDATADIGLAEPSSVIGNTDQNVRTLLRMANKEGKELARARKGGWAVLQRVHTFTTVADQAEYTLPTDFDYLIDETLWDRASYWEMRGPLSAQDWQAVKSGLAASPALRRRWRIKRSETSTTFANRFYVDPTPSTTGETLVFEYVSKNWLTNAAGTTGYDSWQADTDLPILDAEIITLGVVWRFKESKGFNFQTDLATYTNRRDQALTREGGAPALYLAYRDRGLPQGNTPETGFGS